MQFSKTQRLNEWSAMISRIYDGTQNYSKSDYEIHSHLTEVSGAFGKLLFKKKDYESAKLFLPKMLVWAITLFRKVKGMNADLEEALLIKYPRVCSYCLKAPCVCWNGEKPAISAEEVRNLYLQNASAQSRSINDFQLMFRSIYGISWGLDTPTAAGNPPAIDDLRSMYTRLVEELSEIAEAIRFHHLYPSNFNNEIADYCAWWFALVTNFNRLYPDKRNPLLAEDILWSSYSGFCPSCGLLPCDCRPGPVRELLSKPALNDLAFIDGLTQAENQNSFQKTMKDIVTRQYPVALPIACIRIDVDDFRNFNNEMSHSAGDNALQAIVTALRQKVRLRDRIFRVGGDEFSVLCQDLSSLEAEGMMSRVAESLRGKSIKGVNIKGDAVEKTITLSIGIVNCFDSSEISESFDQADKAAIKSKQDGRDKITRV